MNDPSQGPLPSRADVQAIIDESLSARDKGTAEEQSKIKDRVLVVETKLSSQADVTDRVHKLEGRFQAAAAIAVLLTAIGLYGASLINKAEDNITKLQRDIKTIKEDTLPEIKAEAARSVQAINAARDDAIGALQQKAQQLSNAAARSIDAITLARDEAIGSLQQKAQTAIDEAARAKFAAFDADIHAVVDTQRQPIAFHYRYVRATRGYWDGGRSPTAFSDQPCREAPKIDSNYHNISQEQLVDVGGRGTCQVAPYCDSTGEFCRDIVVKSCYIRNDIYEFLHGEKKYPDDEISEQICFTARG